MNEKFAPITTINSNQKLNINHKKLNTKKKGVLLVCKRGPFEV